MQVQPVPGICTGQPETVQEAGNSKEGRGPEGTQPDRAEDDEGAQKM